MWGLLPIEKTIWALRFGMLTDNRYEVGGSVAPRGRYVADEDAAACSAISTIAATR
jgi:hypothetical protein